MPDSEATQALIEARDYIIAHGWQRGPSPDLTRPMPRCMIEAFVGHKPTAHRHASASELVLARLRAAIGVESNTDLINWNDHIAQDQDEVIEAFNRAIKG